MGLPSGLTAKTVTFGLGTFANGDVVDGTVTITAPVNLLHVPTGSPIFSSAMQQRLVNGQATFELCPTDHPDLNRRDWTYTLIAKISGALKQPDPVFFLLPAAGPDTVDLDALVSVPSSAGTPVSVSVATLAGPNVYTGTQDFTGATVTGIAGGGGGGAVSSVAGRTGAVTLTSADVTDATTVGKNVLTAADAPTARAAIGAGTSSFSGAYSALTGAPALSTVATTGAYADLTGKPTIPAGPTIVDNGTYVTMTVA